MHYSIVGSGKTLDIVLNIAVEALQCSVQGSTEVKYSIQCDKDFTPGREGVDFGRECAGCAGLQGGANIARGSASWQDGVNFHQF